MASTPAVARLGAFARGPHVAGNPLVVLANTSAGTCVVNRQRAQERSIGGRRYRRISFRLEISQAVVCGVISQRHFGAFWNKTRARVGCFALGGAGCGPS